jgi:hypothetical protein
MRAIAVVRKFRQLHPFDMEAIRVLLDEAQKPSDIELENPVWVHLISRLYGTRLNPLSSLNLVGSGRPCSCAMIVIAST